jgi:hypothetical protein
MRFFRENENGVRNEETFDRTDTRTLDYGYDSVGNRIWTRRDGGNGDAFAYDYADQVTGVQLNIQEKEKGVRAYY